MLGHSTIYFRNLRSPVRNVVRPAIFVRHYRSQEWFGKADNFTHRSVLKKQGWPPHLFDGRPVIGIANSWSELSSWYI